MKSLNRYNGINPDVTREVYYCARKLVRRYRMTSMDVEDVEQELMLHYLLHKKLYDPTRASLKTFLKHIFANKCSDIIRHIKRQKRCVGIYSISIDEWLANNRYNESILYNAHDSYENMEFCVEFNNAISKLPKKLAMLLSNLKTYTVSDTSRKMCISRSGIYSAISNIRNILHPYNTATLSQLNIMEAQL